MTATQTIPATAPRIDEIAPGVQTRVPQGALSRATMACLGAGAVGLVLSLIGMFLGEESRKQALFSYLVAYMFTLGIALGSLFFVMIQHITRAGWSVVVRRIAENAMAVLWPWMPVLFLPIAFGYHDLYHHWVAADPADGVIAGKSGYLSVTFFFVRAAIYFAVWAALATFFRRSSLRQDESGDPAITLRMARVSAPGLLLFALSITFAAFDWMMSVDPHWYSTIFGVCYFAGATMAALAVLGLMSMFLQRKGLLRDVITDEHYHDIGKLTFAFVVFWTYVNFSQFMLIWYANIPEETLWYQHREGWSTIFAVLAIGHFLVPFAFLMSRHTKRNPVTLAIAAVFLLVMHWFDMQYVLMPNLHHHMHVTWLDATTMVGLLGLFSGLMMRNIASSPVLPERDPRLAESMHFHNV